MSQNDPPSLFRALSGSSRLGVTELNGATGRIEASNEAFARAVGATPHALAGKPITALFAADSAKAIEAHLTSIAAGTSQIVDLDAIVITPDGTGVLAHVSLFKSRAGEGGQPCVVAVVTTDASRQRHDEAAARLAAIVASSDDAIISKNLDSTIVTWNEAATRLFGYRADEVVGGSVSVLIPAERADEEPGIVSRLRRGEKIDHYETVRRRKDGTHIDVSLTVSPIRDDQGTVIGAAKIVRDISDRKRNEALALLERDALRMLIERADLTSVLRVLVEAMRTMATTSIRPAIHMLDISGTFFENVVAPTLPETYVQGMTGLLVSTMSGPCCKAVQSKSAVDSREFDAVPGWGGFAALTSSLGIRRCLCTPILSVAHEVLGTLALYYDGEEETNPKDQSVMQSITRTASLAIERARADAALARTHDELRRIADELSAADRAKNEFLAMLSHELRNPLAALVNAIGLQAVAKTPERALELREMMDRQTRRMVHLLDQLLDLARVVSGKLELASDRVDVAAVCRDAIETLSAPLSARQHRLTLAADSEPGPFVIGDAVRLTQVVENLLGNAIKYTDAGGAIELRVSTIAGAVELTLSDTGSGMSAEFLPRAFDVFAQAPRGLDRTQGGMGLGLPLVKRLVEMHGGTVHAASSGLGHGSVFSVRLPLAAPQAPPLAAPELPASGVKAQSQRRILVVDDEVDAGTSLADLLELDGHVARAVTTGQAALDAMHTFAPEIVFLDLGLPEMDGYEVARRIRAAHPRPLLLVAVTGYRSDQARLAHAGFDRHILKPPAIEAVQRIVGGFEYLR